MNSRRTGNQYRKEGGIAIVMLLIAFTLVISVASYFRLSINNARNSYRAEDFQRARLLAGSALNSAKAQLKIALINADIGLTTDDLQIRLNDPNIIIPPVFKKDDAAYELTVFLMDLINEDGFVVTNTGNKEIAFQDVQITVGITNTISQRGATAACTERVRIIREPYLRYILFFDGLLELHPGPRMFVDGDVRSNNNIELWAGNRLYFDGSIHCPGDLFIFKSDKSDSYSTESRKKTVAQNILIKVEGKYKSFYQDNTYLDSSTPNWNQDSLKTWQGKVLASDLVKPLNPPLGSHIDNHILIEPPDNENDSPRIKMKRWRIKRISTSKLMNTDT